MSGLAAALQAAKLKKTNGPKTSSGSPGSANDVSNGGSSNYGTVGRSTSSSGGGGMASMMDEMQKTLARRRAKVDRSSEEPDGEADRTNHYAEGGSGTKGSSPGKQNAGSESPKPETHAVVNGNGSSGDLEVMKQEILREMRKEINKAKQEIIDGETTFS